MAIFVQIVVAAVCTLAIVEAKPQPQNQFYQQTFPIAPWWRARYSFQPEPDITYPHYDPEPDITYPGSDTDPDILC